VDDAVARYRVASETNDIDGLMSTLSPEVELLSPLSGRMLFRGHADIRILAGAVYGSLRGLRWREEIGEGNVRVLVGEGRVGPARIGDAMVFELGEDGLIHRIRPHLRPWLGLTVFALVVGPKMAGHPGVIWRALTARR
jgi:hypothetical protein